MGFNLLILRTGGQSDNESIDRWPDMLRESIPDIEVNVARSVGEAMEMIGEADAAFGNIVPEVFEKQTKLRWIACPQAGPPAGYYHNDLIGSEVTVTNTRDIYNDHISNHIMSYVLAFARGLHTYIRSQVKGEWKPGYEIVNLPDATAVVVGIGGIGGETARLCSEFGMTVIGVDPRVEDPPKGVSEIVSPDDLDDALARADFVIVTVPETPQTQRLFTIEKFRRMRSTAHFINIGRGATVALDDLATALEEGEIRGAALDVFEIEPLPLDHPLWEMPNVIITPHCAGAGPYLEGRRTELFVENCVRFSEGRELKNVVDKANWF